MSEEQSRQWEDLTPEEQAYALRICDEIINEILTEEREEAERKRQEPHQRPA